jgi:GNAT superfamily N-acetyltransferase
MKESEQTIEKHPTQIRVLLPGEINQAVECFSTAIARDWPNSKEEAASWVADEFPHAGSIIFGAYDNDKLVGTCSLVTASYVIERLKKDEKELVIDALQKLEVDLAEAIYIGGFSVEKKYEARGTSSQLFTSAQNFAISKGYTTLIAHTARPSGK